MNKNLPLELVAGLRMRFSYFIIFLIPTFLFSHIVFGLEQCETSPDDENVRHIVNLCKTRLNIKSLKCKYTSIWKIIDPQKVSFLRESNISEFLRNLDFEFTYQDRNFFRVHHRLLKEKYREVIGTPNNLFEVLVKKLSPYQKEPMDPSEQIMQVLHYYYKGTLKTRSWYLFENIERNIYGKLAPDNFDNFSHFLDPRVCFGYCNGKEGRANTWPKYLSFYLVDSLDRAGKFYFYKYDKYRVLWHESRFENPISNNPEYVNIEVWIDPNENLHKISYIFYPSRMIHLEGVKELLGENFSCDYPSTTYWEYYFYDHKEYENGIRLPMKTIVHQYKFDEDNPIALEIRSKYVDEYNRTGKRDLYIKYLTELSKCENATYFSDQIEIYIHPESVNINKHIPEETFIATEPDVPISNSLENNKEERMGKNIPISAMVFVSGCVLVVLIGMFITKRYFGWGT